MIRQDIAKIAATFIAISAVLLAVLVPGGPIETRSFSHLSPVVLALFNTFNTTLGLGSLVLVFFMIKGKPWAFILSLICAISYFLIYLLDLAQIFPKTPDKMSTLLMSVEIVGSIVALPLAYYSIKILNSPVMQSESVLSAKKLHAKPVMVTGLVILLGIGIIVFATVEAMK